MISEEALPPLCPEPSSPGSTRLRDAMGIGALTLTMDVVIAMC